MLRYPALAIALFFVVSMSALAQKAANNNDSFDVQSTVGDMHLGSDADAKKVGLPLYPGARLKPDDSDNSSRANLSLFTEAFGFKLVVAKYESDDAPDKVIAFYHDKLKKYGKVLECHSEKHGDGVDVNNDDKDSSKSKELKCEENSGPVTELKVGTEDDQHVVAIEPRAAGKGTTFSLVYVRSRGQRGEL
jgi:hypothetical protein